MAGNAYAGVLPATQFGHMSSPAMTSSANHRCSGSFTASSDTLSNCGVRTARLVWRSVMHSSCMLRVPPHACCWHAVLLVACCLSLCLLSAARCASCCCMVCSASSRCSQYVSCPLYCRLGVLPSACQTRRLTHCLPPCSPCHCLLALRCRFACRLHRVSLSLARACRLRRVSRGASVLAQCWKRTASLHGVLHCAVLIADTENAMWDTRRSVCDLLHCPSLSTRWFRAMCRMATCQIAKVGS